MIQKPRGTFDILPEEMPLWLKIEDAARRASARFGFGEIRFPTFEVTELFQRGVGGDQRTALGGVCYTVVGGSGAIASLYKGKAAGVAIDHHIAEGYVAGIVYLCGGAAVVGAAG